MLENIIGFSIRNKLVVLLFTGTIVAFGLFSIDGSLFVLVKTNAGDDQWVLMKKKVETGFRDGKMVEILPESNLSGDEKVVVKGGFGIS
jgi:hypothetical protein